MRVLIGMRSSLAWYSEGGAAERMAEAPSLEAAIRRLDCSVMRVDRAVRSDDLDLDIWPRSLERLDSS